MEGGGVGGCGKERNSGSASKNDPRGIFEGGRWT